MHASEAAAQAAAEPLSFDFPVFARAVRARFEELARHELYTTDCGDLFAAYLAAYPAGSNPLVRQRTLYDCQACKHFLRRAGGLVAIRNNRVATLWELPGLPPPYRQVAAALDAAVRTAPVTGVFRTEERQCGVEYNYDAKTNERHDHFHAVVADRHFASDPEAQRGALAAVHQVFKRGLVELRATDLLAVLDLIDANGLYRGAEHRPAVAGFLEMIRRSEAGLTDVDLYTWEHLGDRHARFRNTVIGTLLVDLAAGQDLEQAVRAFEQKVAPANYKRPTAVITQKMVEAAVETVTRLGLHGALARRYARLSDVSVTDVLFVDNDTKGQLKDGLTALLEASVRRPPPDLSQATRLPAEAFVASVLPGTKTLDLFLENRHQGNFVSLTGADGPERLFKWDNNFAWAYDGDVADSVKQRVKAAGGKVDCKLRVSLSWYNFDDLDLHALTPNGHIYFRDKRGILDVDMNAGGGHTRNAVENLAFTTLADGIYEIYVNQFARRETVDVGFAIEVEYGGQLHQHSYGKSLKTGENVRCFRLHVRGGELTQVEADLPGGATPQEKWGVKTETLVPVAAALYSPNHWGSNAVGAKHLFFMLKGCVNPGSARGIFNEYLRPELTPHGKVFEVLASRSKCPPADEQVSGVGFTAARGDTVTVVVDGKRAYTLLF